MATFPHALCQILLRGAETPTPVVARSDVERGIPRQRRTGADSLVQISVSLGFETAQASADFEAWFWGDALAGAAWFDFTHPRTGQVVRARIVGGDIGGLTPLAAAYGVAERSLVLEYVRQGFTVLPPGLHAVAANRVLSVQRASTATYIDALGQLQTAAAHVARFSYFTGKNIYNGPADLVAGPGVYGVAYAIKNGASNPANLKPGDVLTISADVFQDAASLADGAGRFADLYLWFANSSGVWIGSAVLRSAELAPSRISATVTLPASLADMDVVGVGVYHAGGNASYLGTVSALRVMVERGAVATAYEPGAKLLVEPAATNYLVNNNIAAPAKYTSGGADGTIELISDSFWPTVLRITKTSGSVGARVGAYWNIGVALPGDSFTVSIYLRRPAHVLAGQGPYADMTRNTGGLLTASRTLSEAPAGVWHKGSVSAQQVGVSSFPAGTAYVWLEGPVGDYIDVALPCIFAGMQDSSAIVSGATPDTRAADQIQVAA